MTRYYHRTRRKAARAILRRGFKDATGTHLTAQLWTGVWVANVPLDSNEGAKSGSLLAVDIQAKYVRRHEWKERGKGYREFLVPAKILNKYGKVSEIAEEAEEEELWKVPPRGRAPRGCSSTSGPSSTRKPGRSPGRARLAAGGEAAPGW